jgi:hypothetical protein
MSDDIGADDVPEIRTASLRVPPPRVPIGPDGIAQPKSHKARAETHAHQLAAEKYTKRSQGAVRRLAQLGFDPIAKMVEEYADNCRQLERMEIQRLQGGRGYSEIAFVQLKALQQKLVADLLRYGYARVPETVQLDMRERPKFVVVKHSDKSTFEAAKSRAEDADIVNDSAGEDDDD